MRATRIIDNLDELIDTRDIDERIEFLESEEQDDLTEDEQHELRSLSMFRDEHMGDFPEWSFGTTLIRDSFFTQYAEEFAEDIGAVSRDSDWPNCHIDWDAAARSLQMDYTQVIFDGSIYWGRA